MPRFDQSAARPADSSYFQTLDEAEGGSSYFQTLDEAEATPPASSGPARGTYASDFTQLIGNELQLNPEGPAVEAEEQGLEDEEQGGSGVSGSYDPLTEGGSAAGGRASGSYDPLTTQGGSAVGAGQESDDEEEEDAQFDVIRPAGLKTKHLPIGYLGEQDDASNFRGKTPENIDRVWSPAARDKDVAFKKVLTRYMRPAEQAQHEVSVAGGKLANPSGPLDTRAASGIGTYNGEGKGKHIFTMTPDGKVRSADPWALHRETPVDAQATAAARQRARATGGDAEKTDHVLEMINHSSLAAQEDQDGDLVSGEVAAAGELQVDQGKLQQVSDASGHYKPDGEMTYQALDHFAQQGVDMRDVALKLVGKKDIIKDGQKVKEPNVHASAVEFMNYGGGANAETDMRQRRKDLQTELGAAVGERQKRRDRRQIKTTTPGFGTRVVPQTPAQLDPRWKPQPIRRRNVADLIKLFGGMYS